MDKNEQQDIIRTIKAMHKNRDYHGILAVTKDVNPDKIRDRRALEMVADAYNKSGLYKEAREYLLIAYERFSQSRGLAYKLAVISVKLDNLDDAVDFYEDFCRLAPNDNNRYILKYIIGRAGGIEAKDLIKVLEIYNEKESDEKWMYELARLYHEVGRVDECVALCDEIALWYADGEYEKLAYELKFMHRSLSKSQQARYEQIMHEFIDEPAPEPVKEEASDEEIILEEEAESFVSEFIIDAQKDETGRVNIQTPLYEEKTERIFAEAKGKDPSVETFRIPVDKVNEVLQEQKKEEAREDLELAAFSEVDEKINEILGNRQKNVNRPRTFSEADFADIKEEIIKEAESQEKEAKAASTETPAYELMAAEPEIKPEIKEEKTKEAESTGFKEIQLSAAAAQEPAGESAKENETQEVFAKQAQKFKDEPIIIEATHEGAAYGKLGVSALKRSKKAALIRKPSLSGRGRTFVDEPILKENVDTSNIPIANEEDGQIGINLVLLDKNDNNTIEGQLTIDEFFEQYAGKVAESKDHVAAVEAERLRQIVESVSGMEATPLYDMNFDTPDEEEFTEEEIITIVSDEEIKAAAQETQMHESAQEAAIAATVAQILAAEAASEAEIAQEKESETDIISQEPFSSEEEILDGFSVEESDLTAEPEAMQEEPLDKEEAEAGLLEEADSESGSEITKDPENFAYEEDLLDELFEDDDTSETEKVPQTSEDEITDEIHVPTEEMREETLEESGDEAEESIPEEGCKDSMAAEEETGFENSMAGLKAEAAHVEEAAQEEPEEAEEMAQEDSASENIEEAAYVREEETGEQTSDEILDEGLAAALARFEKSMNQEALDENPEEDDDSLFGFGDDLADLIMGGSPIAKAKEAEPDEAAEAEDLFEESKESEKRAVNTPETRKPEFVISPEFRNEIKEFLLIDGIEEEIASACDNIAKRKLSGDTTGGNLIITGDKKSGKTYLAIAVIKAVIKAVGIGSGKVVKVQAQPLNGKNISSVLKKIEGRDLIIENVGYLKDDTIRDLINVVRNGEFKQMIVLEGNTVAIENIILHFPEIEELFASRINIHELTITQWANIAKQYAKEQGYIIDDMAALALHAKIDKINVPNARLGLGDIKDIVDSAISKASRRNNGRLFAAFSKKSKDEVALTESDFAD